MNTNSSSLLQSLYSSSFANHSMEKITKITDEVVSLHGTLDKGTKTIFWTKISEYINVASRGNITNLEWQNFQSKFSQFIEKERLVYKNDPDLLLMVYRIECLADRYLLNISSGEIVPIVIRGPLGEHVVSKASLKEIPDNVFGMVRVQTRGKEEKEEKKNLSDLNMKDDEPKFNSLNRKKPRELDLSQMSPNAFDVVILFLMKKENYQRDINRDNFYEICQFSHDFQQKQLYLACESFFLESYKGYLYPSDVDTKIMKIIEETKGSWSCEKKQSLQTVLVKYAKGQQEQTWDQEWSTQRALADNFLRGKTGLEYLKALIGVYEDVLKNFSSEKRCYIEQELLHAIPNIQSTQDEIIKTWNWVLEEKIKKGNWGHLTQVVTRSINILAHKLLFDTSFSQIEVANKTVYVVLKDLSFYKKYSFGKYSNISTFFNFKKDNEKMVDVLKLLSLQDVQYNICIVFPILEFNFNWLKINQNMFSEIISNILFSKTNPLCDYFNKDIHCILEPSELDKRCDWYTNLKVDCLGIFAMSTQYWKEYTENIDKAKSFTPKFIDWRDDAFRKQVIDTLLKNQ